jgi:hypothetical protein
LFECWRKRHGVVCQDAWLSATEICQHSVYTIERGARHQANEKLL